MRHKKSAPGEDVHPSCKGETFKERSLSPSLSSTLSGEGKMLGAATAPGHVSKDT